MGRQVPLVGGTVGCIVVRAPLVVEVVGPAGAGKTTISHALCERRKNIQAGVRPRRVSYVPFFMGNAAHLLRTWRRECRASRWFSWEEIRAMVYLEAWHRALRRRREDRGTVTILDHGPVFRLAFLQEFGPPQIIKSKSFEKWWDGILNLWASTLDLVIWLDASDPILVGRIQARHRWHVVKGQSEEKACKFLERYRRSYAQVLRRLTASGGPRVLSFNTEGQPVGQIVDEVLRALDSGAREA